MNRILSFLLGSAMVACFATASFADPPTPSAPPFEPPPTQGEPVEPPPIEVPIDVCTILPVPVLCD